MTSPGGSYLPPVVAQVTGDSAELIRVLEDAKARLTDFAHTAAQARLSGNPSPLNDAIAQAKLELADFARQVADAQLGADAKPFWADIAKLRAEVAALNPLDLDVDADTTLAMDKIAAMKLALAGASTERLITGGLAASAGGRGGGGAAGTLAAGSLGALFGAGKRSGLGALLWGETGGGFLSRLLSPASLFGTMFSAGFGSVGSFAGFGPEHLAMILGGLLGTGVEATAGAGLLGLGSLGKEMVGGGADTLANRSAEAGVSGYASLAQAVAEYGKGSVQATEQANLLAYSLRGDSKAAKAAEKGIADAANALKVQWHKASSGAQIESTKIMAQVLGLAKHYAGQVAQAAKKNLTIVNNGLKPLFAWLKGPGGEGVFKTLEKTFSSQLPTAVHAFDQGVKLLLRTMALVAPQTGGLVRWLNRLLTRMNSAGGFAKWSAEVHKLIGDFRLWMALLKAVGHDLHSLFANDAGTPQAILKGLTKGLQDLGKWEDSAAGKASLFNLFSKHKTEILQLGKALGGLGEAFGKVYLKAAPAMVSAVNAVLKVVTPLITAMSKNNFTAFILGLTLIAARLGLLKKAFTIGKDIDDLKKSFSEIKGVISTVRDGVKGLGASMNLLAANPMVLVIAAVVALGVAFYEAYTHSATFRRIVNDAIHAVETAAKDVVDWFRNSFVPFFTKTIPAAFEDVLDWVRQNWPLLAEILIAIFVPGGPVIAAVMRFHTQIAGFFEDIYTDVTGWVSKTWSDVESGFKTGWSDVESGTKTGYHDVVAFFKGLWKDVKSGAKALWSDVKSAFKAGWSDLKAGAKTGYKDVLAFFKSLWSDVKSGAKTLWKDVESAFKTGWKDVESTVTTAVKTVERFFTGLWRDITTGITGWWSNTKKWFSGLAGKIKSAIGDAGKMLYDVGRSIVQGLINGVKSMASAVGSAVSGVAKDAVNGVKSLLGIHSPSALLAAEVGVPIAQGIAVGITQGMPGVKSSLTALTNLAKAPDLAFPAGAGSSSDPQLDRIEQLLSQILDQSKEAGVAARQTASNTKDTVTAARGLSSPAGVQAQINQSHARLVTALRAGSAR